MLRVCLVEDESSVREMLRDTIPWEQCGYMVAGEAGDGEMALSMVRQVKPDVLVTDIWMPFMDGLALSRLVRKEFPQTKIILLSGYKNFEYAQQAIEIGIEQYLLKPVPKEKFIRVLEGIRQKIEQEYMQHNYFAQFHQKAQEYEQYARRHFFEQVVTGMLSVQQIYEEASKLDLDLQAQSYTLAFFSVPPEGAGAPDYTKPKVQVRGALLEHFLKYPEYLLFRWDFGTYIVLMKGDTAKMPDYIHRCISTVQDQYQVHAPGEEWHVAVGKPTQRLSTLSTCFQEVSRLWAYRYLLPGQHILLPELVDCLTGTGNESGLLQVELQKLNPGILQRMFQTATEEEVVELVDDYMQGIADGLSFKPFCHYVILSIRFTALAFVEGLGVTQEEFLRMVPGIDFVDWSQSALDLKRYMAEVLIQAIHLRDHAAQYQGRSLLQEAVHYIDQHYTDCDLSLNRVAQEINISANYLSAVFSQEMGKTFTEYVTKKRMGKARELLQTTDKRSGEVAFAVGYRDAHYFSFLFKKTQGCTPRDYRGKGKR